MPDRVEIVVGSAASLNLEGLRPSAEVMDLAERWARNGVSIGNLVEAEDRILSGPPQAAHPAAGASPGTSRAA